MARTTAFIADHDAHVIDALVSRLGVACDRDARDRLARYAELVASWDARTDLTSARDPEALVDILFLDALVLHRDDLVPKNAHIVDVGAGAGAPTLPILLLRADLSATLVEPRRKRVAFLRTAVGSERIQTRAHVVEGSVDPGAPSVPRAPFDLAWSRATWPASEWLPIGMMLAPRVIVFTATSEPPTAHDGWKVDTRVDYESTQGHAPRTITRYVREG